MTKASIKFGNSQRDFALLLNKRVNEYFRINNIERHANTEMIVKTVIMFSLYFIPYALIVSNTVTNTLSLMGLALVMGIGLAGIGLSVMHDANHGAYSKKKWVNDLIGYSLNLLGATSFNWKLQHNVLHHTYTNIYEEDEDISPRGALRMAPQSAWKPMHRYQHIYAWFLYGLMTIVWVILKDFTRLTKYQRNGFLKAQKASIALQWTILIATKVIYITYAFIIPVMLTSLLWWQVLLGLLFMHYVAGFILAIIFQPAHVVDGTEYPTPNEQLSLEHNWTVHQLLTTTNFGNENRWFSWYVGGLNFQIEHHLFPNVCHVHYRKIAGIVQSTALEFGLPYKSYKTFGSALAGHARMLKQLGNQNTVTANN
jgi:linoleoyl-CoA desaturase